MTTPVVGNRTKAVLCEEKQLGVPSVGAQRPAVRKGYDRALAPVFVIDPRPIFHSNRAHVNFSFPYLGGCCREGDSCRLGCPLSERGCSALAGEPSASGTALRRKERKR